MKLKALKLTFSLALATSGAFVLSSCNQNKTPWMSEEFETKLKKVQFTKVNERIKLNTQLNSSFRKAKILSWKDGDTPVVEWDSSVTSTTNKTSSIRIRSIDTPESHEKVDGKWQDTTGEEYKWGIKAGDFAKKLLPAGTDVYIYSDGWSQGSYNRIMGNIFYNAKISTKTTTSPDPADPTKNITKKIQTIEEANLYSASIFKEGLCLPFISSVSGYMPNHVVMNKMAETLADSYNFAMQKRNGFFKDNNLSSIYKKHGGQDDHLRIRFGKRTIFDAKNMYDMLGIHFDNEGNRI